MKILIISLCTKGIMRDHFVYYTRRFSKENDVYCVTNDNVFNEELGAKRTLNVGYNRKNPLGYFSLKKLYNIMCFVNETNPDIVYIFTHHATSIPLAFLLRKRRVIYQVHDPIPHKGVGRISRQILSLQLQLYSKIACRLVVAGNKIKEQVLEQCQYPEKNIEVIPLAVVDSLMDETVKPLNISIDLLFFGRIEPYKGLDTLIEALSKLENKPETYIIGGGNIFEAYKTLIEIPSNVHITGFVKDTELISYLKSCKVVVLPYHEASGTMTVGQAFYYGKPVIASDVGALPEYVGNCGKIFKHGNADELAKCIHDLLNDSEQIEILSQRAFLRYNEMFTIEKACALHQKMFEKVMEENL